MAITQEATFDILIIGAGPIGLACAIEAQKAGKSYVIIEKGTLVNSLYNYPVFMTFFSTSERLEIGGAPFVSINPKPNRNEALEYYRRVTQKFDLNVHLFEAVETCVKNKEGIFDVSTTKANYQANNVIAATGFYDIPSMLNVPGEDLPKVIHYYKDPDYYAFSKILVVGANNSSVDVALETFRKGAEVTMVIRGKEIGPNVKYWVRPDIENRIKEGAIKAYFESKVREIKPHSVLIQTPEGEVEIENDFVAAMTGYQPNFKFLRSLGVDLDENNTPQYNPETMVTNDSGLYFSRRSLWRYGYTQVVYRKLSCTRRNDFEGYRVIFYFYENLLEMKLICHYTSIEVLGEILENSSFRFKRIDGVDDEDEYKDLPYNLRKQIYISSYVEECKESEKMWCKYGDSGKGVRLHFNNKLHVSTQVVETKQGVDRKIPKLTASCDRFLGGFRKGYQINPHFVVDQEGIKSDTDYSYYHVEIRSLQQILEEKKNSIKSFGERIAINSKALYCYKSEEKWGWLRNEVRYLLHIKPRAEFFEQSIEIGVDAKYLDVQLDNDVLNNHLSVTLGPLCDDEDIEKVKKIFVFNGLNPENRIKKSELGRDLFINCNTLS